METAPQRKLFRQTALDRLASPEQLDRLVTVTDPYGWIALLTIAVLLLFLVFWSILGTIPTRVKGQGIVLSQSGQVADAMAHASGTLAKFTVSLQESVKKGQPVAIIDQSEVNSRWQDALAVVREKEEELRQREEDFRRQSDLKNAHFAKRKAALAHSIQEAEKHVGYLQNTLAIQEKHAAQGMLELQTVEKTRDELSRSRQELADKQHEIHSINGEALDIDLQHQHEHVKLVQSLNDAQRSAAQYQLALARDSTVIAPMDGRIIEFKVTPGAVVQPGQALLSIESAEGELQALIYLPTEHGKKLHPGVAVQIEPATVKKEEYGTLMGVVREVSEFPVTSQGIVSVLQNQALANSFSKDGPPYAVHVDLIKNANTVSGYRWTSNDGPPIKIASGTTLNAEITVLEQQPISLLIPFLRKTAGIYQ
jgi:HlyD family secretion protein